jgi:low affinity Fe/Cu permease
MNEDRARLALAERALDRSPVRGVRHASNVSDAACEIDEVHRAMLVLRLNAMTPSLSERFHKLASKVSAAVGSPPAFMLAVAVIAAWILSGPVFRFSDTWQLVINTGTTIVTFLMVFLIQNTQNRDARATHLKLDELIRAVKEARNELIDLEEMSDAELDKLGNEFRLLHSAGGDKIAVVADAELKERASRPSRRRRSQ